MSRRACGGALGRAFDIALGLALAIVPCGAQDARGDIARLTVLARARAESARVLGAQLDSIGRTRYERETDTVRVGPIVIATSPGRVATARRAAEQALRAATPIVGASRIARILEGSLFSVSDDTTERSLLAPHPTLFSHVVRGKISRVGGAAGRRAAVVDVLARFIGETLLNRNTALAVAGLGEWATLPVPEAGSTDGALARAYDELATWNTVPARACAAGDRAACRAALGWQPAADPLTTWFNAGDRRILGSWLFARTQAVGRAPTVTIGPCDASRDDATCLAYLRSLPPAQVPAPLGPSARESALLVALDLGGDGALDRLEHDTSTTVEGRLVAAARMSSADLVEAWRRRVVAARPEGVAPQLPHTASGVLWVLAFGLLAVRVRATS